MQIRWSLAKGLLIALTLTLIPISTYGTDHAGPKTPSCGNYKVIKDDVIVGVKFPKGTYQINAFGISCAKVMGSKGLFAKFLKLRDKDPLPKPWRYLADAVGAPKFTSGAGVGFRVQLISPTRTISTIMEPKAIKSFQDAVDRPKDVSYWAWKKSRDQTFSNNSKGPNIELTIGPNTKLTNPNPLSAFDSMTKLYPDFRRPKTVFAIYYSYSDIDWAQKKYAAVYEGANGQEAKNGCQKVEFCWGASATIDGSGNGVILAAVMTSNPDRNHTSGTLEAHEYTHVLQISSFFGTGNQDRAMCCLKAFAPWWFVEGGAHFSQLAAIYTNSFAKYSEERKFETNELLTNRDKKYTEKWIANFIKPPDTSAWREDGRESWHLYDLGMLVSEVFTAIKGPAINIQIFTDISKGMTFEKSFEQHFGLPWDDAVKMIAKSISLLVKN